MAVRSVNELHGFRLGFWVRFKHLEDMPVEMQLTLTEIFVLRWCRAVSRKELLEAEADQLRARLELVLDKISKL